MTTPAPIPLNEAYRLTVLAKLENVDPGTQEALDAITNSAQMALGCSMALVSFVERDEQVFRANCGLEGNGTPRDQAFCAHAIMTNELMIVPDAALDRRFADNPLVTGAPFIRFYAGAPLTVEGALIGTLCVLDTEPRDDFGPRQRRILQRLADAVCALLVQDIRNDAFMRKGAELVGRANAAAQEAELSKQRFLRLVSHELRTPLNAILGFADLLEHHAAVRPALAAEYGALIGQGGRRLLSLVDSLLDYSSLERGAIELKETRFDLAEVMAEAAAELRAHATRKGVEVIVLAPLETVQLRADRNLTMGMLAHLLENAIDAAEPGSQIRVASEIHDDEGLSVIVGDDGPGYPQDIEGRLQDPFEGGADLLSEGDTGLGMGLPITRQLIEAHGGRLVLESPAEGGARAWLRFPSHRISQASRRDVA